MTTTHTTTREPHPGWQERVRDGFARQPMMQALRASIASLEPGKVVLEMPYDVRLSQQHGYLHAGATATLADSACGYAAYTMAPEGFTVLTVEYKINLVAPAHGNTFAAEGTLLKGGRTLSVCNATVTATDGDTTRIVAHVQATIMLFAGADR
jgi:uncharacterized protein (TIGR00369 family)